MNFLEAKKKMSCSKTRNYFLKFSKCKMWVFLFDFVVCIPDGQERIKMLTKVKCRQRM